jgi:hypothetical protein
MNVKSRKLAIFGITVGVIWQTFVYAYLVFFAYEWIWGTEKGRKQMPALEAEFARINTPSSDSFVSKSSNYKSTHASLGKKFSSPLNGSSCGIFT